MSTEIKAWFWLKPLVRFIIRNVFRPVIVVASAIIIVLVLIAFFGSMGY